MDRKQLSDIIYNRLIEEKEALQQKYEATKNTIGHFFVDDLLPKEITLQIHENFPKLEETVSKKNIRENKFVAYQMDKFNPILEEITYAFQDSKIVKIIAEITGLKYLKADEHLYAGGLSLMNKGSFLNTHLDNSHDKDRNLWRALNLLFYVTPNWELEYGGNLELWENGLDVKQTTITSKFNRLAVMETHQNSWHSVSKVEVDNIRCCVSNYYFSSQPVRNSDTFHVTTFRANKNEKAKDFILKIDNFVRGSIRKVFKKGVRENPHQYKK